MSGFPSRAATAIDAVLPHAPHRRCPRSWRRHRSQMRWPAASRPRRLELAAVRADGGARAGSAWLAHAPARRAGQRFPGPAADRAGGNGERGRAARDQLGGQPPGDRRRSAGQGIRVIRQRRSEVAQRLPGGRDRINRGGDHRPGQRRPGRCHQLDDAVPAAARAVPPPARRKLVAGRAAVSAGHRALAPGRAAPGRAAGGAAARPAAPASCCPPMTRPAR